MVRASDSWICACSWTSSSSTRSATRRYWPAAHERQRRHQGDEHASGHALAENPAHGPVIGCEGASLRRRQPRRARSASRPMSVLASCDLGDRGVEVGERPADDLDPVRVVRRRALVDVREAGREEDVDLLVGEARRTCRSARAAPSARPACRSPRPARAGRVSSGLLALLVELAGRDLEQVGVADRLARLAHEPDVLVVVRRRCPTAPGWRTISRLTSSPSAWRKRSTRDGDDLALVDRRGLAEGLESTAARYAHARASAAEHAAGRERGGEEQRVLHAAHRARRQARWRRSRRGRPRRARQSWRPQPQASRPPVRRARRRPAEQQLEHGARVVREAAVARARVGGDMRGATTTRQPSASAAWAVSSATSPPWPSAEPEPRMPGPGPHTAASQPRAREAVVERAGGGDRLALRRRRPGPAVTWPASRPRSRSSRTTRECPPGQRAARGLHVAEAARRARPAWNAQASGASCPCRKHRHGRAVGRPGASGRTRPGAACEPRPASTACCRLV